MTQVRGALCRLCLVCLLVLTQAAAAADDVALNFVNADIDAVIRAMSKITRRNFIVDPRVKGTLNIVTNTPVSPELAYQMLLSALRLQGYAVVEGRGVTEVVPEADAKVHAVPVTADGARLRGDRVATQVFAIKNESAAQLVPVIRPLVSANNSVTAYASNNTLVVTDYAENLRRIGRIIEAIDVPQGDAIVIPLQHASAIDLAGSINRLLAGSGGDGSQRVAVIADERANALLVRSDNPAQIAGVRQLAASLDQAGWAGNVHVVYLKNADATALAQTLRGVLAGESADAAIAAQPPPAGTAAGTSAKPASVVAARAPAITGAARPAGAVNIQADPVTNALIVTAPEGIYNNLRRVIDMLDRRRAQVYVEALIAEMTADRAAEFGIQWQSANISAATRDKTTVFGGTNFGGAGSGNNILGAATNPLAVGQGLNLLVGSGTLTIPGLKDAAGNPVTIFNLSMLARFLDTQTNTNILSTPNLVMMDNEEAKIVVGQNLPFVTGQYVNTGGGTTVANPFQTITRQDVGLTLRIKPQISEGGTVRLQIYEETSSVVASSAANAAGPITNKRSIETTALVDDGAIIALGGLVEDSYASGVDKVPLLGDVPVLGNLFKYDTRSRTKTNLVVFLRPKILRDADAYRSISTDRYDYIIGQQRLLDAPARLMSGEAPAPELPLRFAPALGAPPAEAKTP